MTSDGELADVKNDDSTEVTEPPPGPTDHGRTGGMATREVAPDVVKRSGDQQD